jgi:hypothetical protein
MATTFSCPRCGRELEPPHEATGGSGECPGCGSPVDGHEPVYDAELVESPAAEPELRRPCPVCGAMIIATAAKCRFCGEVFDEVLRRGGRRTPEEMATEFESSRKRLLVCIFVVLGCILGTAALEARKPKVPGPTQAVATFAVGATYLATALVAMVETFTLTKAMSGKTIAFIAAVFSLVPCLGLLVALGVYQRALEHGQEAG